MLSVIFNLFDKSCVVFSAFRTFFAEHNIQKRTAEGKGKYISFDKEVDTSTSTFPDTTWIIKNVHHNRFSTEVEIATEFCRGTNVTVESSNYPRFIMYDEFTRLS